MAHINPFALGATKWIGTGVGVCGAILVAFNLGVVMIEPHRNGLT